MARRVNRGEIWLLDLPRRDKRRPFLVISRDPLIEVLNTVTVAAVTSTPRGVPTEVKVGIDEGLKKTSCVNLCNLFTIHKRQLGRFVCTLNRDKMNQVCQALAIATACD